MDTNQPIGLSKSLKVLQRGETGELVCKLQQLLNSKGSHIAVDGVFGGRTLSAVISFQQRKGLPVTGQVDELTWQALFQYNSPTLNA